MPPESPVALLAPDGGVVVAGRVCARLGSLVRASLLERQHSGFPPSAEVLAVLHVVEQAAADHESRRAASTPRPGGPSALAAFGSASPRSQWVDVSYAASALGVTERQVRRLCESGTLHSARDERGQWRIDPQSIEYERARRGYGQVEQHGGTDS